MDEDFHFISELQMRWIGRQDGQNQTNQVRNATREMLAI